MVLQLEYCTDVIIDLHPEFDILLLFGHSCRHYRVREYGLNVKRMCSGYGGLSHLEMHPTKIKQDYGYLTPHPCIIKPGQVQYLVFQDNGDSPSWVALEEREPKRHSQLDEPTNYAKTKAC